MEQKKRSKMEKVDDAFEKADKVAEAAKEFLPPEGDAVVDRYVETGKMGWGIFRWLSSKLKKNK